MNNRNIVITALVVIGLLFAFMVKKNRNKKYSSPSAIERSNTAGSLPAGSGDSQGAGSAKNSLLGQRAAKMTNFPQPTTAPASPDPKENVTDLYRRESQRKVEEVLQTSSLKAILPEDHLFDKIDIDMEGTIALYGQNSAGNSGMAFVAAKQNPGVEQVMQFLKESADSFPNLKSKFVKWGSEIENVDFKKESGISDGKLWKGIDSQGMVYAAVLLKRRDGQGSYLFVKNGTAATMNDNEDYYERFREGIQALPLGQ